MGYSSVVERAAVNRYVVGSSPTTPVGRSSRLATAAILKIVEVLKPLGVRLSHLPLF